MKSLTILSFGGGQDSTAILLKMIDRNSDVRSRYVKDQLIVVMSDTGDEHPYTYDHVDNMKKICWQNDIPFFFLQKHHGYHVDSWPDLISPQLRSEGGKYKPSMVQLGTKSCTDNLKLTPIYKFVDEYINAKMNYGFTIRSGRGCNKQAIKKFYKEVGEISVLIGFAKGEESRVQKSEKLEIKEKASDKDGWKKGLKRFYPLIDLGMGREECQKYIKDMIGYCPMPSNCMRCPYQSLQEILWLYRNYPDKFAEWVEIENRKLIRDSDKEKNYGVYANKKTLSEKLTEALEKYGHMTFGELNNYKMSHGCTTNSV